MMNATSQQDLLLSELDTTVNAPTSSFNEEGESFDEDELWLARDFHYTAERNPLLPGDRLEQFHDVPMNLIPEFVVGVGNLMPNDLEFDIDFLASQPFGTQHRMAPNNSHDTQHLLPTPNNTPLPTHTPWTAQQAQPRHHAAPTAPLNPEHIVLGYILSNGHTKDDKYKCHVTSCTGETFGRLKDLKRHNVSRHNRERAVHWCPVDGCGRSKMIGGRAFPRKDHMINHLERMHVDG
ncbi:hypothetical protein T440DRAFT_552737 [Plenodomus tracheiphilus IPT5]|uniref:C2H2-type domain-containing protein n=1 Tax=Plenodomus tracheiphilus IPT5 TaxID=1408161 RepID=A0A6A7BGJ6_9PLEO|nr:hypothetical protein T440DRAFT_552737 [Plenodomus tracheiphilus IPT5]